MIETTQKEVTTMIETTQKELTTIVETTQKETKTNKKKFWIIFGIALAAYIGICFFLSYCQGYF